MFLRRMLAVSLFCVVLVASGCGSSHGSLPQQAPPRVAPHGTITGVAQPCAGQSYTSTQYAALTVTVTLSRSGHVINKQMVSGSHIYRFTTAPGSYVVSSLEGIGGSSPVAVKVTARRTTHADIPSHCE